jgi:hypothetical protein
MGHDSSKNQGSSENAVVPALFRAIDLGNGSMKVVPLRSLAVHYNVTNAVIPPKCTDCIYPSYVYNSGGWWDITVGVHNPTKLTGYDVRVVVFDELYYGPGDQYAVGDDLTPSMPNGLAYYHWFASYKTPEKRKFPGNHFGWQTWFSLISETPEFVFAFDASYPGNCKEPYQIINFWQSNPLLGNGAGACTIRADIYDWQSNVGTVYCDLSLMGGSPQAKMNWIGGVKWSLNLGAFWLVPDYYPVIITAFSPDAGPNVNSIRDLAFVEVW